MVQQGDSIFFETSVALTGGTLLAGVLLLKAGGLAIYALHSAGQNRRGRGNQYQRGHGNQYPRGHGNQYPRGPGYRRGKRETVEDLQLDEIDQEVLQKETETIFRHLDETDPAHCFRRYICVLSTGKLDAVSDDHMAILNLVSQPIAIKSKAFEYRIAASIGQNFANLDVCEALYECPLTGKAIDKLFV